MARRIYAQIIPDYRSQQESIDTYINDLKEAVNIPQYGQTPYQLLHEKKVQNAADEILKATEYRVVKNVPNVADELRRLRRAVRVNKDCLKYLTGLTAPVDGLSKQVTKTIKRTLDLQEREWSKGFWNQDLTDMFRSTWENMEIYSLLHCFHLNTTAEFHNFFYEGRKIELELNKLGRAIVTRDRYQTEQSHHGTEEEAKFLAKKLQNHYDQLNGLAKHATSLVSRSRQISPIYLRVAPIKNPLNGVMLCDYKSLEGNLNTGDHVSVLSDVHIMNNSSRILGAVFHHRSLRGARNNYADGICPGSWSPWSTHKVRPRSQLSNKELEEQLTTDDVYWKVRTTKGHTQCVVPSICVGLVDPDLDAREKAITLYRVLVDTWGDFIQENIIHLAEWFKLVFLRWINSQLPLRRGPDDMEKLLRNVTIFLYDGLSSGLGYDDEELKQLASDVGQLNTGATKFDGNQNELNEDIESFNEIFIWLQRHQEAISICKRNLSAFQVVTQKPYRPPLGQNRAVELMRLVNKLITHEPQKAAKLLDKMVIWNKSLDETERRIHCTADSSDESSDYEPSKPHGVVKNYVRNPTTPSKFTDGTIFTLGLSDRYDDYFVDSDSLLG
ncbi:hypothetical protein T265_09367 [Opisthorchis viverrini]|uniref:Desmoplakin SH3 domain-containing protein n=1 Tax=Opisthorchis viverrini TaxID=6198 RepID=A0A075A573_OPIVI|nr:hypothetical protein T265_09367 [Opisthorchis viverrini]KER22569.1 hypothetical protein T265_09367 [Opisthorchis viverrini]